MKKNEVYSYVGESKLGKILSLNSKYIPKAISKHGKILTLISFFLKSEHMLRKLIHHKGNTFTMDFFFIFFFL